VVLLGVLSSPAFAQQDVFRDALIGFHSKLAGVSGDEGPAVVASLDRMAAALASWPGSDADADREPDAAALAQAFERDREDAVTALYVEGFRLIEQHKYRDALASFRNAVARDPLVAGGPGETHRRQAATYADAGDEDKSLGELEAAVKLAPDDERANVALGRAL